MAHYRSSVLDDCSILAPKMREQDAKEVWHSHGSSPLEALVSSFVASDPEERHTIIADDGEIIGMFGCAVMIESPKIGVPWLLASDKLPKITKEFLPQSKEWIERLHNKHDLLYNHVFMENKISIRWLKWMGFKFLEAELFGTYPAMFYPFVKLKGE